MAQCLSSLGPIPSQPLDFVGSSEDSALKTSESEKDIGHKQDGDSGMESMFGRMNVQSDRGATSGLNQHRPHPHH